MTGHLHLWPSHSRPGDGSLVRSGHNPTARRCTSARDTGTRTHALLTVHAVNATAGLFAGGRRGLARARRNADARLRLVGPSATRVHRAARGGIETADEAVAAQVFTVEAGGWLEVWPEVFIPHAGSRCQPDPRTSKSPGAGGCCFARASHRVGWRWARRGRSRALRWATDIVYDGLARRPRTLAACRPDAQSGERGRVARSRGGAWARTRRFTARCFSSRKASTPRIPGWQRLHDLQADDDGGGRSGVPLWIGVSRLGSRGRVERSRCSRATARCCAARSGRCARNCSELLAA